MKRRTLLLLLFLSLGALIPTSAFAQEEGEDEGFVLRINGDLVVGRGERVNTAVVINGDTRIEGTVEETLVVIDGDAVVSGRVEDNVVIISGALDLSAGARVEGDIRLIDSDLDRAPTAVVGGDIERGWGLGWWAWAFPVFFWTGMTVAVLLSGLVFAAVAGRQLSTAGGLLTGQPGWSILAAVLAWVGLPVLAVLIFLTIIGIPFGIGLLVFLLPALFYLGYLVAGTRIGSLIVRGRWASPDRPYLAAVVGLGLLQLVALVPVLGWLVALLAGLWGSGGLVLLAWRSWRRTGAAPPAVVPAG